MKRGPVRGGSDPDRPRIFCIGLNKTGTSSFHEAMQILGFDSLHWGGTKIAKKVRRAIDAGAPLLSNLSRRHDAFSDIGSLSRRFVLLDSQYPGSRFVLTVRPVDEWLDSRRRHVERNMERSAEGSYNGTFLEIDEPAWREEWKQHLDRVHSYFGDRDDFLEIDITRSQSWEPFCRLLDVDIPGEAFPWENRDRGLHT